MNDQEKRLIEELIGEQLKKLAKLEHEIEKIKIDIEALESKLK